MQYNTVSVDDLRGKVDFGLITIRNDEFEAVLKRFPPQYHARGNRYYAIHRLRLGDSDYYQVAIVRCIEPGEGEAQAVARDLVVDLAPQWLLLVGIAGGVPEYEFTLGDVVVASRLLDFTVGAAIEEGKSEYAIGGGPMHKAVQVCLANLSAMNERLQDWNDPKNICVPKPPVELKKRNFYGSKEWQRKVKDTLNKHFGRSAKPRPPLFTTAPIASSDQLVKDTQLVQEWLRTARHIRAIEMELAGVYRAAWQIDRVYPILAIRGISDIVGFKRHPDWTTYACHSAASFAHAFLKARLIEPVNKRSPYRKAYDEEPHGHMLQRERLSKEDLEMGHAVKPQQVEQVVQALEKGRSVAVQGPPGSGKSALAAWVQWLAEKKGQLVEPFFGREEQKRDRNEVCKRIESIPSDHILLIDDIHLVEDVFVLLKSFSWSGERRFLLLGRTPYVEKALRSGKVPKIHQELINITADDSMAIAEALAKRHLSGVDAATRLLNHSGKDLVLTKWLLEAVVLDRRSPDSTPEEAAIEKLKDLGRGPVGEEWDGELLRLFLTLAAFGWTELWCPERFIADALGFKLETMELLHELLYEAERQIRPETQGGYALRLLRHPRLCELFLDAAPGLGLAFDKYVFVPTCSALKLGSQAVRSYGFAPLVLGTAVAGRMADLLSIEWRLVYGDRRSDYVNVVKAAAELSLARYQGSSELDLSRDEQICRLEFAFAAANGERRLHGGQAGKALLEELKRQLGVYEIPAFPFDQKGYMLYQDAYLMRLSNVGQPALDRFEESAAADEAWAAFKDSLVHRGKAAMSRIAAAAYRSDLAVFAQTPPGALDPDRIQLEAVLEELRNDLQTLEELLSSGIDERGRPMLEGFRSNALLHLAEVAGWLGEETTLIECLAALGPDAEHNDSTQLAIGLARSALALTQERYEEVIENLKGQPKKRVDLYTGDGAGKTGVIVLISYLNVDRLNDAEEMRRWLVSDDCLVDAGNGLAKTWAVGLLPIGGANC